MGKTMLDDERAMYKDVLAPYAPEALAGLLAEEKKRSPGCPFA